VATRVPASYLRPSSLPEALDALADAPRLVLAGGTDVYPAHTTRPVERPVLDISRLEGLHGIHRADGGSWRIGATTTWTDIAESRVLPRAFDGLREAARQVGGRQIQNAGTIAGNVVNGSPAADGTPNLLVLDAVVECASAARGIRQVPLAAFMTGYRSTGLLPDELVTAVIVGSVSETARSTFQKLGSRAYLVISIVAVAVVLDIRAGRVGDARVAVGACSPVPVRLVDLERDLLDASVDNADRGTGARSLAALVEPRHLAALSPIDDVRAPAGYRLEAALTLVRRALAEAVA
jgi:CO/xanthine dehydrogenase FAD-binding subunit